MIKAEWNDTILLSMIVAVFAIIVGLVIVAVVTLVPTSVCSTLLILVGTLTTTIYGLMVITSMITFMGIVKHKKIIKNQVITIPFIMPFMTGIGITLIVLGVLIR